MKLRFVPGNRIVLLESGREFFPALLAALGTAQREVFLETYIFAGDATADKVVHALCAAALRGVAVHVLIDGFGARDMPAAYRVRLAQAGAWVQEFRRPVLWRPIRGLRRMHRKLAVIDDTRAFVGGINIIDDWNTPNEVPPRFDYAVQVEGPLVGHVLRAARHLWMVTALSRLNMRGLARAAGRPIAPVAHMNAALAIRDNVLHRTEIEDAYLNAMRGARKRVILACGYFLPSRRFFNVLRDAARRGVRVTILLQGPSDHPLMKAASQALYRRLLGAGIEIVEYGKSFLHAKVAVVDGNWATVGSSNMDPFSLLLAREANVVVQDDEFAAKLTASLERAMADGGVPITREQQARIAWPVRAVQWLAYRFARVTVDLVLPGGGRNLA